MTGSPTQSWSADLYARHASFVPHQGAAWVDGLGPLDGLDLLDLGCGDGVLSRRLVERGARVVAVDASPELVAAAKKNGLDARVADGRELSFDHEFDMVFSHAALHWMKPPPPVLRGVRNALRAGGRFVADMGGAGNVAFEAAALEAALDRRGLDGKGPVLWLMRSNSDIEGWLATFAETFLRQVNSAERTVVIREVADSLRPHLSDGADNWTLDYVCLRFAAHVD